MLALVLTWHVAKQEFLLRCMRQMESFVVPVLHVCTPMDLQLASG